MLKCMLQMKKDKDGMKLYSQVGKQCICKNEAATTGGGHGSRDLEQGSIKVWLFG